MKKLSKINLHNLSMAELSNREESLLRGGGDYYGGGITTTLPQICVSACACLYEGEKEDEYDAYYGGATKQVSGAAIGNIASE